MNILHIAWLSAGNFGDDLMSEAVHEVMDKKFGTNEWTIWCHDTPISLPKNSRWIYQQGLLPLPKRFYEKRALNNADMLLIGGGSVLHSYNSCEWKRKAAVAFHKEGKRKVFGIGLGIGPFDTKKDEDACAAFLRELDGCAFRDRASYQFALTLDLPYVPVMAFDLAACAEVVSEMTMPVVREIEHIGVSVRIPYRVDAEKVTREYISLLSALAHKYKKVTLFSFSLDKSETELEYCKQLVKGAKNTEIDIVSYRSDTKEFIRALSLCDFHVTTKFHGAVISYISGIPFTIISYQRKFEDFAEDIGLPMSQRFTQTTIDMEKILDSIHYYPMTGNETAEARSLLSFDVIV